MSLRLLDNMAYAPRRRLTTTDCTNDCKQVETATDGWGITWRNTKLCVHKDLLQLKTTAQGRARTTCNH